MPVTPGSPPVTWATIPGDESDGIGVSASLYSIPCPTREARIDRGYVRTYQARSCWCSPSTDSSSTCLIVFRGGPATSLRTDHDSSAALTQAATRLSSSRLYRGYGATSAGPVVRGRCFRGSARPAALTGPVRRVGGRCPGAPPCPVVPDAAGGGPPAVRAPGAESAVQMRAVHELCGLHVISVARLPRFALKPQFSERVTGAVPDDRVARPADHRGGTGHRGTGSPGQRVTGTARVNR
jgi:hypothetical protein